MRRLEFGKWVREDEWKKYIRANEVLDTGYMIKNEPFERLHFSYRPVPEHGPYPPRLSVGFSIQDEIPTFRRVALKKGLVSTEQIYGPDALASIELFLLVMDDINDHCGLPREEGVKVEWVQSREGITVVELASNYDWRIPEEKFDEVVNTVIEYFDLDKDSKPKWYLEPDIDLKAPEQYLIPLWVFELTKGEKL